MKLSRLSTLLEAGDALPETGTILVLGATAETDLSDLPADRLRLVQGFRPDHDALFARGLKVVPTLEEAGQGHAAALVHLPRARAQGRDWVRAACAAVAPGAPVWVDGQKTDGIDSMQRDLRERVELMSNLTKSHGRILRIDAAPAFDDWATGPIEPAPGFVTRAGVFSAEGVDRGSALLAAALPGDLKGRIVELGAGWGWLSAQILARASVKRLDLVEADHAALACARANVTDPRAQFHWADATRFAPELTPETVVMNPPFHQGRAGDPNLGAAFIRAAAAMLPPPGVLWMVANRHLPYESALASAFREVSEQGGDGGFKVIRAAYPVRAGKGGGAHSATERPAARGRGPAPSRRRG